jgi:hypothetical protein
MASPIGLPVAESHANHAIAAASHDSIAFAAELSGIYLRVMTQRKLPSSGTFHKFATDPLTLKKRLVRG